MHLVCTIPKAWGLPARKILLQEQSRSREARKVVARAIGERDAQLLRPSKLRAEIYASCVKGQSLVTRGDKRRSMAKKALPASTERVYKILVIGDGLVGKTSFVERYVNNRFIATYKATLGGRAKKQKTTKRRHSIDCRAVRSGL